jgi:hypothetical protein
MLGSSSGNKTGLGLTKIGKLYRLLRLTRLLRMLKLMHNRNKFIQQLADYMKIGPGMRRLLFLSLLLILV